MQCQRFLRRAAGENIGERYVQRRQGRGDGGQNAADCHPTSNQLQRLRRLNQMARDRFIHIRDASDIEDNEARALTRSGLQQTLVQRLGAARVEATDHWREEHAIGNRNGRSLQVGDQLKQPLLLGVPLLQFAGALLRKRQRVRCARSFLLGHPTRRLQALCIVHCQATERHAASNDRIDDQIDSVGHRLRSIRYAQAK